VVGKQDGHRKMNHPLLTVPRFFRIENQNPENVDKSVHNPGCVRNFFAKVVSGDRTRRLLI
jgi:hypothetical protein